MLLFLYSFFCHDLIDLGSIFGSIWTPFGHHFGSKKQIFLPWVPHDRFLSILIDSGPHFYRLLSILDLLLGGFWIQNRPQGLNQIHLRLLFPNSYGRQNASCPDTHICAYTHIYTLIRTYIRIHAHIYAYIHIRQQEKIDAMNLSSLGPRRWSAKRPNARGLPPSVVKRRSINKRTQTF